MKKYIFSVLIALLTLPVVAQHQSQAKVVLDKTAAAFRNAGGVKADFSVKSFSKGRPAGNSSGVIQMKGEKFQLETPETVTWFDGKTQWSYLTGSEEVNVSTPAQEELQGINPYTLLYMYQKGFSSKLGTVQSYRGKSVTEIILTADNRKQELSRIVLYVTKEYQPVYILLEQRDKSRSEIAITGYQTGLNYTDATFVFDRKQYPHAEIIDLR